MPLPQALSIPQLSRPHASIPRNPLNAEPMFLAHYAEKAGSGILDMISRCRQAATEPSSRESLQDALGMKDREHFRKTYLDPLVSAGWLERTIPDKPTSRLQKYRLTDKDRAWLAKKKSNGSAK